jgi:hypothetical protein
MRLLFICPSQDPGRCGVGDYTSRLAAACADRGVACAVVALKDKGVLRREVGDGRPVTGDRTADSRSHELLDSPTHHLTDIPILRLSADLSWAERVRRARAFVEDFGPDWVSLQYVPYGFHPRGYCFRLGGDLREITGEAKRHVFFHEIALGLHREECWKNRLHGLVQRQALRRWLKAWPPDCVHTHADPYVDWLRAKGIPAEQLPLFGNIPIAAPGPVHPDFDSWVERRDAGKEALLLGGYFGAFYPGAANTEFVQHLDALAQKTDKTLILFLAGRQTPEAKERWDALVAQSNDRLRWIFLGELPGTKVSSYLQALDFGIAATPYALIGKSGSVAAMRNHGLPVLAPRNDWTPRFSVSGNALENIYPAWGDHSLKFLADAGNAPRVAVDSLPHVADSFLAALEPSNCFRPAKCPLPKQPVP